MTIGINTFLFAGAFTNEHVALFPTFKTWGFDSVEIAMDDPTVLDARVIHTALEASGLQCGSACAAMGPGRDLRGAAEEQATAVAYIKACIDLLPQLGCRVLGGPLYSVVGRASMESPDACRRQWVTVVSHLRALGDYAGNRGVILAVEPLNRYETDFINTASQALELIYEVNHPHVKIHLDSYHMNIEEKHPDQAIIAVGEHLAHFHACGVDRGTPGNDHTDWTKLIDALKYVGYTGSIVIESFTPDVKVIAKAASIWRATEPSQEAVATEGLSFLRQGLQQANNL